MNFHYQIKLLLDEDAEVIICFAGHPIMIVTEYMENGSLDTYLRVSLPRIIFFFTYLFFLGGGGGRGGGIMEYL